MIVLEVLSQILPDHTYVTELRIEGDKLRVIGVTRDAPALIRLIEQSPHFTRATFFAPTTRAPSDPGERFHIEAQIEPVLRVTLMSTAHPSTAPWRAFRRLAVLAYLAVVAALLVRGLERLRRHPRAAPAPSPPPPTCWRSSRGAGRSPRARAARRRGPCRPARRSSRARP